MGNKQDYESTEDSILYKANKSLNLYETNKH